MLKNLCSVLSVILYGTMANAQSPEHILQRSLRSVQSHHQLTYKTIQVNKSLFSDKDTSVSRSEETLQQDSGGKIAAYDVLTRSMNGRPLYRNIYHHDTLFTYDLKDSIYSFKAHPNSASNALSLYTKQIEQFVKAYLKKTGRLNDTVIGHSKCFALFVRQYDTIVNNNHNFTYKYIYIDKKTSFPCYTKEVGAGSLTKSGYEVGRVNVFNEIRFENFKPLSAVPAGTYAFKHRDFWLENKTMLAEGDTAPDLILRDLADKAVPRSSFQDKVMLIQFGSTTCAANPLANPVMNRLNKKYDGKDVRVICIYSDENGQQAKNYIEANGIEYPVFLGNAKLKRSYKTVGTPNFYLIDKKGKVIKSIEGYSDKLEPQLEQALSELTTDK